MSATRSPRRWDRSETAIEAALRIRSEASAEDDATAAGDAADDHDEDGENG